MASLIEQSTGRRLIQFVGENRKRLSIRLGTMPQKTAQSFLMRVEHLHSLRLTGVPLDAETSRWLNDLDDRTHQKLVAVGLIEPRTTGTLGEFLERYVAERTVMKPASLKKLNQTTTKLLEFFDSHKSLRSITASDASNWRNSMARPASNNSESKDDDKTSMKLSEATIKSHCGNAKTIFNEAVRRRLITESPFKHLKSGATASRNIRHVTAAEAELIVQACPDVQWKLLFALGRYAGLRVPSESHLLTWDDVNWEKGKLRVRSPKTEHHAGHEERLVPITEQLMPILLDAFEKAVPGDTRLITLGHGGQLHRALRRICKAAGVESWKDAFQTLRRSCEKEWAMTHPQYAVSKWIGHSITVSGRHYANDVPDELFARASASIPTSQKNRALQNALQQAAARR